MKFIDLSDRFARGLVAGFLATVILAGLNLFSFHVLGFTDRRYYNFASSLIFGKKAELLGEHIFSQLAQLGFGTAMGIIFAYLIIGVTSKNLFIKGILWGLTIEFVAFAVAVIVRLEPILPLTLQTAISASITNTFWGLTLAWLLYRLEKSYSTETAPASAEEKAQGGGIRLIRYPRGMVPALKPQPERPREPKAKEPKAKEPKAKEPQELQVTKPKKL